MKYFEGLVNQEILQPSNLMKSKKNDQNKIVQTL